MSPLCRLLLILGIPAAASADCLYTYPGYAGAPQLYSVSPDGTPAGLVPALAQRLEQLSGCKLQPQLLPLARRNALLQQGQLQLVIIAAQNQALESTAEFIPLFSLPLRAVVLADSTLASANQLLQGDRYRIGLLHGAPFPPEVEQRLEPMRRKGLLEYSNDRGSLYLKLQRGRLHAVLETSSWLVSESAVEGQALRFIGFTPAVQIKIGIYLSRQLPPADRNLLRNAALQLLEHGEVAALVVRYLPQARGQLGGP